MKCEHGEGHEVIHGKTRFCLLCYSIETQKETIKKAIEIADFHSRGECRMDCHCRQEIRKELEEMLNNR